MLTLLLTPAERKLLEALAETERNLGDLLDHLDLQRKDAEQSLAARLGDDLDQLDAKAIATHHGDRATIKRQMDKVGAAAQYAGEITARLEKSPRFLTLKGPEVAYLRGWLQDGLGLLPPLDDRAGWPGEHRRAARRMEKNATSLIRQIDYLSRK